MFKKDKLKLQGSKVITFVGARGGCGTSTIAINTAVQFAKSGKYVLYIDGDLYSPTAYLYFGVNPDKIDTKLIQSLRQGISLGDIILPTENKKVKLVSESPYAAYASLGDANHEATLKLIEKASENFDITIIDAPSYYLSEFTIAGIERSDEVIIVTDSDIKSIVNINKMKDFAYNLSGVNKINNIIVNKATSRTFNKETLNDIGVNLLFTQYYSEHLYSASNNQSVIVNNPSMALKREVQEFITNINSLVSHICNK